MNYKINSSVYKLCYGLNSVLHYVKRNNQLIKNEQLYESTLEGHMICDYVNTKQIHLESSWLKFWLFWCKRYLNKLERAKEIYNHITLSTFRNNVFTIMYNRWHWPDATVPYEFAPAFSREERNIIEKSMEIIEDKSCIRYIIWILNIWKYCQPEICDIPDIWGMTWRLKL